MATDEEILQSWNSLEKMKQNEAIIHLYRLAEAAGRKTGISDFEQELFSDPTIEAALKNFGWGSRMKGGLITQRAVLREAVRIARERLKK